MKKFTKRFLSVISAAALVATTALSAVASSGHSHTGAGTAIKSPTDGYTITLTESTGSEKSHIHFAAYQVFSGTVPDEDDESYPTDPGAYTDPGENNTKLPITDLKFGTAFGTVNSTQWQDNIVKFIYALATSHNDATYGYAFSMLREFDDFINPSYTTGSTGVRVLADKFYKGAGTANSDVDFDYLAQEVADVLAAHADRQWLQAFTDILGGYAAAGSGSYLNKGFLEDGYYYQGEGAGYTDGEASAFPYQIKVPAGYYMVVDLSSIDLDPDAEDDEAFSARMLMVASDVSQEVKSSVPVLTKEVYKETSTDKFEYGDPKSANGRYDTEVAGVGDTVQFRLTGTLPSNYDNYLGGYQYTFIDTLSTVGGLEFVGTNAEPDAKITVTGIVFDESGNAYDISTLKTAFPDGYATIELSSYRDVTSVTHSTPHITDSKAYDLTYVDNVLTLKFPCLKEIELTGDDSNTYYLGYDNDATGDVKSSVINVEYSVKVTEKAVVGTAGNKNGAQIQYSNNPQAYADTNYTTEETSTVFTFGLNILKEDAAEFIKHNSNSSEPEPTALDDVEFVLIRPAVSGTANTYDIAVFTGSAGVYEISEWKTDAITYDSASETAKALREKIDTYVTTEGVSAKITTYGGGKLNIKGLNDNITYTLVETKTNDDGVYAYIDPFTFKLTAAEKDDEYTGMIESNTVDHKLDTGSSAASQKNYVIENDGTDVDGTGSVTVLNFKYTDLPSTGGIGVYIYYIAGGCVLVAAAVLFYLSSRKKSGKKSA